MKTIQTHSAYRLLIDGDLKALIEEALALGKACLNTAEYSDKRQDLENRLYDLYQEIGWSVVYDVKKRPF